MSWIFNPFSGTLDWYVGGAVAATVLARLAQNDDYRVSEAGDYRIDESQ